VESKLADIFMVWHHWSLLACDIPVLAYTFYVTANKYSLQHNYSGFILVCLYPLVPRSVTVYMQEKTHCLFIFVMFLSPPLKQNPSQVSAEGSLLKPVGLNTLIFHYHIYVN
jgi:hypothetical protein